MRLDRLPAWRALSAPIPLWRFDFSALAEPGAGQQGGDGASGPFLSPGRAAPPLDSSTLAARGGGPRTRMLSDGSMQVGVESPSG